MESLIIVIHILSAVAIIGLVLIQHGKGADMGASFGSGASQTIFGSAGSGNVLTKSTTWLAILFFITSLSLAVVAKNRAASGVEVESLLGDDAAAAVAPPAEQLPDLSTQAAEAAVAPTDQVAPASVDAPPADVSSDVPAAEAAAPDAATAPVEPAAETTEN